MKGFAQMEERKAPADGKNRSFEAVPKDRLYRYIQRCAVDFLA